MRFAGSYIMFLRVNLSCDEFWNTFAEHKQMYSRVDSHIHLQWKCDRVMNVIYKAESIARCFSSINSIFNISTNIKFWTNFSNILMTEKLAINFPQTNVNTRLAFSLVKKESLKLSKWNQCEGKKYAEAIIANERSIAMNVNKQTTKQ